MPTRKSTATWNGVLKSGSGKYTLGTGASGDYSFTSRFENGPGSSPEELLAAAEAACYSMALSADLEKSGTPGKFVRTNASCTVEKTDAGQTITTMDLEVEASVPGIDDAAFQTIANKTKDNCPVSRAFKGNVNIRLKARLV
jgi:osmotically inducible protein OsmC